MPKDIRKRQKVKSFFKIAQFCMGEFLNVFKRDFYLKLKKPLNAHNTADVLKIVQDGGIPGIYGLLFIFSRHCSSLDHSAITPSLVFLLNLNLHLKTSLLFSGPVVYLRSLVCDLGGGSKV